MVKVVITYNSNIYMVCRLLFFELFLFILFSIFKRLLFEKLLFKKLIIKISVVFSKISILLAIVTLLNTNCFLLYILFLKYHCKVFCDINGLFTNKLSLVRGQYLFHLVDHLIFVYNYTNNHSFKIIVKYIKDHYNSNTISNISIWYNDQL